MRTVLTACGAVAVAGLIVAAQAPQSNPAEPRPSTQTSSSMGQPMTITGCLKPVASTAESPGAAAAGAAAGRYMLTSVASGAGASTAPGAAATPTTGSAARPAASAELHDSFVLSTENASVNFGMHVNHKVEVTGTQQASKPGDRPVGTTGSTSPGAPGSTSASGGRDAKGQTPTAVFNVTSLKMVSATCP